MQIDGEVAQEELEVFRRYVKTSPVTLVGFKAQAVLMASEGMGAVDIGFVFDRVEETVDGWLSDWGDRGLGSIFTGYQNNQDAAKLTNDQEEEMRDCLKEAPSDCGLPKQFWGVPQLKTYLRAEFGVECESERSYHFLLKFSNLSFKYPDTFNRRRNEHHIEQRMAEVCEEVESLIVDDEWEVLAADEVRIEQEAYIRRAWLQKGQRAIVKVNKDKEFQSYFGLLNQKAFVCDLYEMPWQSQQEVLVVLERFLSDHPGKKVAIIWDNAPFRKGKEIREALSKGGVLERVYLIALPLYAPDHNPIEHVWNSAKGDIANIQHEDFRETKNAFSGYIKGRRFGYRI